MDVHCSQEGIAFDNSVGQGRSCGSHPLLPHPLGVALTSVCFSTCPQAPTDHGLDDLASTTTALVPSLGWGEALGTRPLRSPGRWSRSRSRSLPQFGAALSFSCSLTYLKHGLHYCLSLRTPDPIRPEQKEEEAEEGGIGGGGVKEREGRRRAKKRDEKEEGRGGKERSGNMSAGRRRRI